MSIGIGGVSAHDVQKKQKPDDASLNPAAFLAVHQPYTTLANGQPNCVFDVKDTQLS